MRPSEAFQTTKEMKLENFVQIWNLGGERSIGNQFSNMDKANYLECIDKSAEEKIVLLQKELDQFMDSIPTISIFGCGRYAERAEDVKIANQIQEKINFASQKRTVNNITSEFDAGWVLPGIKHGKSSKTLNISPLPENWDEVWLVYKQYPHFHRILVARNNHDGTVQVFKS